MMTVNLDRRLDESCLNIAGASSEGSKTAPETNSIHAHGTENNEIGINVDTSKNLTPSKLVKTIAIGSNAIDIYSSPHRRSSALLLFGPDKDDEIKQDIKRDSFTNISQQSYDEDSDEDFEVLPNLANLVAATIRDRVVLEQMEEIKVLKKQVKASNRVEITGEDGIPVYARGDFNKGKFNWDVHTCGQEQDSTMRDSGIFWDVGLKMKRLDDEMGVPLENLEYIEIRIGGVLYCTSDEVDGVNMALGIRPGNCFDHKRVSDMNRSVVCEFNPQDDSFGRNAFLTFHVPGFSRVSWRSLQSISMLNRSNALLQQRRLEEREERRHVMQMERLEAGLPLIEGEGNEWEDNNEVEDDRSEPFDLYRYITQSLSHRNPEQRANFTSISFCVKSVRSKINNLTPDYDSFENERNKVFEVLDNQV